MYNHDRQLGVALEWILERYTRYEYHFRQRWDLKAEVQKFSVSHFVPARDLRHAIRMVLDIKNLPPIVDDHGDVHENLH